MADVLLTLAHKTASLVPDEIYLKLQFKRHIGRELDLENPQSFNEKMQWLKLYYRNPEYTKLVDKYAVKSWVSQKIGSEYVIPTIAVFETVDEIQPDVLPDAFVLKTTHDSGTAVICKDKCSFDWDAARRKMRWSLKRNYYADGDREWPYKHVPHRIIAEPYLEDRKTGELPDYKFFCFDGTPKAMFIATERFGDEGAKFDFFDMDFNHLPFTNGHPNATHAIEKPENFELMKELAARLSEGMPHVRVDFYQVNGKVLFGEMTFFHWSGLVPFEPYEWDLKFGSWINLPEKILNE